MGRVEYDYRDGVDGAKGVYIHDEGCTCAEFWMYTGYIFATWLYASAFFALFLYAWTTDVFATFWTFIAIWLFANFAYILIFAVPNIVRKSRASAEKKRLKLEALLAKEKEAVEEEERQKVAARGGQEPLVQEKNAEEEKRLN